MPTTQPAINPAASLEVLPGDSTSSGVAGSLKPFYADDYATIYCGDCREILPQLPKVDLVLTDPPYGIGIAANPVRQKHEKSDWDNAPVSSDLLAALRFFAKHQIIWGGNYFDVPPTQCFLIW